LQSFKDKSFIADIRSIIEHGRQQAYTADRQTAIATFWNVGWRIVEEEQKGESRAAYITRLIHLLADRLKAEIGDGNGKRNLAYFRQFYLMFSDLEILHKHLQNLEWSYIRMLSVTNAKARQWYLENASNKYVEWTDGGRTLEEISRNSLH
jgi:hypothetical protein